MAPERRRSLSPGTGSLGSDATIRNCALRVRAGESSFDSGSSLDLTTRTQGWPALAAVPAGGSRLWLRVLDEDDLPVPSGATARDVESIQGWQWYLLDLESAESAQRNVQPRRRLLHLQFPRRRPNVHYRERRRIHHDLDTMASRASRKS